MASKIKLAATLAVIALVTVCVAGSQWTEPQEDTFDGGVVENSFNEAKAEQLSAFGSGVSLETSEAARGQKNGRTKKSKRKGVGLWMGKRFEYGRRKRVLLQDGSGFAGLDLELRPADCGEKIVGYAIKKYSSKVLSRKDVSVSWERFDGDVSMGKHGCAVSTYNITADVNFNLLPGKTDLTVSIFTNKGGKKRVYSFKTSFLVVGLVLYERSSKRGIVIRSGDGHRPMSLGNFKKIRKHVRGKGAYRLSVAVQGPDGRSAPNRHSLDIRAYDPLCDSWPKIINWDSSCPSAYVTKKGMKRPRRRNSNFRSEGYQCNASFTKDLKHFFFLPNKNRVGCGKLCFEVTWPALKVRGNVFTTSLCFDIDTTPSPPAVVDCVSMQPDYYGGDQFSFNAFNLDSFQDSELGGGVPSTFRFGAATWDVTEMRMTPVDQVVTLRAPAAPASAPSNTTSSSARRGWFEFERPDGTTYRVRSRVQCASSGRNGMLTVKYKAPLVARPEPVEHTSSSSAETVEVQVFTPLVEKISADRVARYVDALAVGGGRVVGIESTEREDEALRCEGFICALREAARRLGVLSARAENRVHGTEVKIHLQVNAVDTYEVVDRLLAGAEEFSAQVGVFGAQISYVGEPREAYITVDSSSR